MKSVLTILAILSATPAAAEELTCPKVHFWGPEFKCAKAAAHANVALKRATYERDEAKRTGDPMERKVHEAKAEAHKAEADLWTDRSGLRK